MTESVGTRRQQAEERREQILDAALRQFSQKGFAGASIRDIAREVGVTEGLIYHYFESKEQLEQACWKERSWHAHLERILAAADGVPLRDVLQNVITDFLLTLYEQRENARMCAAEMPRNPEMAAELSRRFETTHGEFVAFLRARQATGEARADANLDAAAGLLMGGAYSLFLFWSHAGQEEWKRIVGDFVRSSVDVVLRGIS